MKHSAYTALVKLTLEYGAVCWDPYREGQVSALNWVQNRAENVVTSKGIQAGFSVK